MDIVLLDHDGHVSAKKLRAYGGRYSFLESLLIGGTGSPKVCYQSGIPAFDELAADQEGAVSFVSFELLKKGLLLRLNRQQKLLGGVLPLTEIRRVHLLHFRRIRVQFGKKNVPRIEITGELTIYLEEADPVRFTVPAYNLDHIRYFFGKKPLRNKFTYALIEDDPTQTTETEIHLGD